MPVPADIVKVLNEQQVTYSVLEAQPYGKSDSAIAKAILMQKGAKKILAIFRNDSIVDVDSLCALTSLQLQATPANDILTFCKNVNLDRPPSIPGILGIETVLDQRLLDVKSLYLDTGKDECFISVDKAEFKKLITNIMNIGDFGVMKNTLNNTALDDTQDAANITTAIANFTQLRIKQRLEETIDFPPLPITAQRIIKLRVNPNADIKDLTDIVEADPALASQVVSWAASPYYAAPGKIKSVHDAIVRVLGFDLVLNLSLGLALGKTLELPKDCANGFTPYWKQAVYAATAVEALVGSIPPKHRPSMGIAYLSGLLHNFGYLILAEIFPPYFSNICRHQEANSCTNHAYIERHLIGVTREQLVAWLMRLWNMPDEVCTALRFQNELSYEGEEYKHANLLFVAMRMLRTHGIGDAPLEPIPDIIFERLYLDKVKAAEVIQNVIESSTELNTIASNMAA